MTIAVIDTGVDYTLPELVHAFGDYKGYDFFDNDEDPMNSYDPNGETQSHGTHVSGTIVARSFGIAPDARMLAYRVLDPNGGTSMQVMAGIEQVTKDEFIPYAYVPGGAEYLEIAIYSYNAQNGSIGGFLGYWDTAVDVEPGFYEFNKWDGSVQGYKLSPGEYVIIAYAEYLDKSNLVAFLFEIK